MHTDNTVNESHSNRTASTIQARPRKNYYTTRNEIDPFPDESLLGHIYEDESEDIKRDVNTFFKSINSTHTTKQQHNRLRNFEQ